MTSDRNRARRVTLRTSGRFILAIALIAGLAGAPPHAHAKNKSTGVVSCEFPGDAAFSVDLFMKSATQFSQDALFKFGRRYQSQTVSQEQPRPGEQFRLLLQQAGELYSLRISIPQIKPRGTFPAGAVSILKRDQSERFRYHGECELLSD